MARPEIFAEEGKIGGGAMKRVIVTADDFGLSSEVNRAVVNAHQTGILTCASLMISAPFAGQAVALARKCPGLRVGLHLVLVDGLSILAPGEIPRLVSRSGRFPSRPSSAGVKYYFSSAARHQLMRECEAQIEAFLSTGLALDHLNSHHHLHIHPTIAGIVLRMARKYRVPAVRLPLQEMRSLRSTITPLMLFFMLPWSLRLRRQLRRQRITHNDAIIGLSETGCMDETNWLRAIPRIKPGITEIFCHPAMGNGGSRSVAPMSEYHALLSEKVKYSLAQARVDLTTFSEVNEYSGNPERPSIEEIESLSLPTD